MKRTFLWSFAVLALAQTVLASEVNLAYGRYFEVPVPHKDAPTLRAVVLPEERMIEFRAPKIELIPIDPAIE